MSKQVPWNEEIYSVFCKLAMLSTDEREILRMRIMGYTVTQTSMQMNMSVSKVNRTIDMLKKKYDKVVPLSEGRLPQRRMSAQETWQDEN